MPERVLESIPQVHTATVTKTWEGKERPLVESSQHGSDSCLQPDLNEPVLQEKKYTFT